MFKYEQQFEQTISVTPDTLFFAFRYALGRRTFAPSIVAKEIKRNIKVLPASDLNNIATEIMEVWAVGELGDECDIRTWTDLHDLIEVELERRERDQARDDKAD